MGYYFEFDEQEMSDSKAKEELQSLLQSYMNFGGLDGNLMDLVADN